MSMQGNSDTVQDLGVSLDLISSMPRKSPPVDPSAPFGKRLASVRQKAGFSQRQLADISNVSQRMVAYYERRDPLPPGHILTALSNALGMSVDQLIGSKPAKKISAKLPKTSQHLYRRLQQLEQLPLKERREVLRIIDTYLEKNRLSQQAQ
ncbi:MAG: helix-turn-helix transcriptional regulator [Polyangiaceae bacterium]|nr:helix-turn-helix transcriptional regulator [Polyangiaceae bacterium]